MITNRVELIMRRRNVQAFIDADVANISLRRVNKVPTSNGSFIETPQDPPLAPQRVRIVDSKRRYAEPFINSEAGDITKWPYIMLGRYDLDVREGDTFTWNGNDYEVKSIKAERDERTVAAIDYFGTG